MSINLQDRIVGQSETIPRSNGLILGHEARASTLREQVRPFPLEWPVRSDRQIQVPETNAST